MCGAAPACLHDSQGRGHDPQQHEQNRRVRNLADVFRGAIMVADVACSGRRDDICKVVLGLPERKGEEPEAMVSMSARTVR